jgi:hypothetical protein
VICLAVAAFLLALSLSHLVDGIMMTTGSTAVQAALMAGGIDLSLVACEIATFANVKTHGHGLKGIFLLFLGSPAREPWIFAHREHPAVRSGRKSTSRRRRGASLPVK